MSGYTDRGVNPSRKKDYMDANATLKQTVDSLVAAGVPDIFYLTEKEIGQDLESMVDGTHPNDIGMMHYADAYAKKISAMLDQPITGVGTTLPITQRRDFSTYDWELRHQQVLNYNQTHQPSLVLIGNSITHFWGGNPVSSIHRGQDAWDKYFGDLNPVNMGFGWDMIENVHWRIYHGELDGFTAKHIYLNIGTNNLQANNDDEILTGIASLIHLIHQKQPSAHLIVSGIYPRKIMEERIRVLNQQIAKIARQSKTQFADPGKLFLQSDHTINASLFTDGLHPNAAGYDLLGAAIRKLIQ